MSPEERCTSILLIMKSKGDGKSESLHSSKSLRSLLQHCWGYLLHFWITVVTVKRKWRDWGNTGDGASKRWPLPSCSGYIIRVGTGNSGLFRKDIQATLLQSLNFILCDKQQKCSSLNWICSDIATLRKSLLIWLTKVIQTVVFFSIIVLAAIVNLTSCMQ